jgi:hypothetical protein
MVHVDIRQQGGVAKAAHALEAHAMHPTYPHMSGIMSAKVLDMAPAGGIDIHSELEALQETYVLSPTAVVYKAFTNSL